MWRTQLDKMEAGLPPEKKTCNFGGALGVTGNLGLHEWVNFAFYPVTEGQLQAGIHPAPGSGKPSAAQGPKSSGQAKSFETGTDAEKIAKVVKWQRELKDLQKSTAQHSAAVETASQKIDAASTDLKNKVSDAKQFRFVMAPYLQARYGKVSDTLKVYQGSAKNCSAFKSNLDDAAKLADDILSSAGTTNTLSSRAAVEYGELETLMTSFIERSTFETDYGDCANKLQAQAEAATILPKALPDQVDPPINSVSHSLQFVVTYGAGISPSWSLLQWKGPGGSGNTPLFGASGTRTHTLNLALGPRSGTASISADALRLINNQVIRSLRQLVYRDQADWLTERRYIRSRSAEPPFPRRQESIPPYGTSVCWVPRMRGDDASSPEFGPAKAALANAFCAAASGRKPKAGGAAKAGAVGLSSSRRDLAHKARPRRPR